MSHGKIDNNPEPNDGLVERLNRFLARLMGKKPAKQTPKPNSIVPSNRRFILIVVGMAALLWGLTGVYYIPEGNYGLIFRNGKIIQNVKGVSLGVTLPYPLSNVAILDATINNLSVGKESTNLFQLSTKDNYTLQLSGELSYSIINPQKYYLNYYQETSDLDQKVAWLLMANTQKYFLQHIRSELLNASSIVLANEIRQQTDWQMQNYGLSLSKFNITLLQKVANSATSAAIENEVNLVNNNSISAKIIQQAYNYQKATQADTKSLIMQYNNLLPQYQANESAIVELVYYKMLSSIPNLPPESYPLLQLTQAQFMSLIRNSSFNLRSNATGDRGEIRMLDRSVRRQRNEGRFINVTQ